MKPECDHRGLSDGQLASLTGFTGRIVRALTHLREAWCIADASNKPGVEAAIRTLLETHSFTEPRFRVIAETVLAHGLGEQTAETLVRAVQPPLSLAPDVLGGLVVAGSAELLVAGWRSGRLATTGELRWQDPFSGEQVDTAEALRRLRSRG
jgi:hypothetical protein